MNRITSAVLTAMYLVVTSGAMAANNFGSRQNLGSVTYAGANEVSGIVESRKNPHVLWLINDNGNPLIAVSTDGTFLGAYYINGFNQSPYDWEDIAIGPGPTAGVDYLYAGNIGDNQDDDQFHHIARVVEPDVDINQSPVTNTLYSVEIIRVAYTADNSYGMDCESLMVDTNKDLYMIGKRTGDNNWNPIANTRLYQCAYPQTVGLSATNVLSLLGSINITGNAMPTGADISPSGEQILIKIGGDGFFGPEEVWHWERASGETIANAFFSTPTKSEMTEYWDAGQDEAVGWAPNDAGCYTFAEGNPETINYYDNLDVGNFYFLDTKITGSGTMTPDDEWYSSGASVTITATPADRHMLDGWSGDTNGWTINGNEISGTMGQDRQITATFVEHTGPNTSNILNYVETFESYTNGFAMPGTNGWSATNFSAAVVTTNAASIQALNAYSESCGYPVASAHDKALKVEGIVTNSFDMSDNQVIWLDKMMQANHIDSINTNLITDSQAALYFNPDGHPMILHYNLVAASNCWTEITEITADISEWVRVTFKLDYQTDDPSHAVRYFQVRINGYPLTNALAWTANDGSGIAGGSWFAMPTKPDKMNRLVLDGKGSDIDDLVLTTNDPLLRNIEIYSLYGAANPPSGTNDYTYGDSITLAVTNDTVTQGDTQYICTGWNMVGHSPASGTGTSVTFTLTNDLALTWLWSTTNYWLDTEAAINGTVTPGDDWYASGSTVIITPNPGDQYSFDSWTGDVPAGNETNNPLSLTMDQPRQITATFMDITYNDWAAGINWNGKDSSRNGDADEDGFSNEEEYQAGTDPMDANSLLQVSDLNPDIIGGNIVLKWQSASNIVYSVELSTNIISWSPISNGIHATPPLNVNTISVDTASTVPMFFRIIVE